ncbi:hypothetical protein N665_1114s0002 [Sinapis alba]|nr:hypothetical protein N665_1114s0002 [Sinapis alba]
MMHSFSERKMIVWSLCLIIYLSYSIFFFASPVKHLCRPDQRDDLWEFKNEFYVQRLNFHWWKSDTKTEKWRKNTDCCSWDGVSCELKTGMVIKLDLKDSFLNGPLRSNSSLLRLRYLQSLSLDSNNLSVETQDVLSYKAIELLGSAKNLQRFND